MDDPLQACIHVVLIKILEHTSFKLISFISGPRSVRAGTGVENFLTYSVTHTMQKSVPHAEAHPESHWS